MDRLELEARIHEYVKENLRLVVVHGQSYNGGMSGGSMYDDTKTVQLWLHDDLISEESL